MVYACQRAAPFIIPRFAYLLDRWLLILNFYFAYRNILQFHLIATYMFQKQRCANVAGIIFRKIGRQEQRTKYWRNKSIKHLVSYISYVENKIEQYRMVKRNFEQNIQHNRLEKRIARKKNRREKRLSRLIPIQKLNWNRLSKPHTDQQLLQSWLDCHIPKRMNMKSPTL